MGQIDLISEAEIKQFVEDRRSVMQIIRRHDEIAFCHSMSDEELKAHLERSIILRDCLLCEWFLRSESGHLA